MFFNISQFFTMFCNVLQRFTMFYMFVYMFNCVHITTILHITHNITQPSHTKPYRTISNTLPRICLHKTGNVIAIQVDQCVSRAPTAFNKIPCLTSKARVFVTRLCRLIKAEETACLMGVDGSLLKRCSMETCSAPLFRDLMGNSFAAPVMAAMLLGVLAGFK